MPAVIFDLDDTLYPHVQYVHSGFAAVARLVHVRTGLRSDEVYAALRIARDTGHRGREFQHLFATHRLDEAMLPDLVREHREHRPQLWLSHGARAVLEQFRADGWRIALLTNGRPSVQRTKVQTLELEALIDHVLYASEYAEGGKPAREPFVEALRRLDTGAHETVMVGDDPVNDVDGARGLGIRTVFLHRSGRQPCARADAVVRLLHDVPSVARQLVNQGVAHAA